jgi:hypothetical protein
MEELEPLFEIVECIHYPLLEKLNVTINI